MSTIDFAAILTPVLALYDLGKLDDPSLKTSDISLAVLAAKVPEACPDCKGTGAEIIDGRAHPCETPHLTIGQMLREWQALTALAEYATHHDWNCPRPGRADCACGLDAARAALEAVRGD